MTTKTKSAFILLCVLVIGVAIGALASGTLRQQREHRFERMPPHERLFSFMKRVIQPTEQQRKDFERIIATRSEQLREVYENHQTEVIAIYDSLHMDLQTVLTEEQRHRFEEHIVKGSHKIAESRIEHLTEALDLNEEQQNRIEEIFSKFTDRPRHRPRDFGDNWQERRKMLKNRTQKMHEEIEAVLTPEQKEMYQEMKMKRHMPFGGPHPPPFMRPRRDIRQ